MSTQNSGHPPTSFSISSPFQHVRLLEAPEDLLNIVKDESTSSLKFKSSSIPPQSSKHNGGSTSARTPTQGQREGFVHLCAGNKVWAVKQVSTSNSVYVIEPERPSSTKYIDSVEKDTEMQDDRIRDEMVAGGAVTAVAQVRNFLELHPVKIDDDAVERAIVNAVPIYHPLADHVDVNLDFQAYNDAKVPISMGQLIDDIAMPDEAVSSACARLGIFENHSSTEMGSRCMIPSTAALLGIWTRIVEGCAIEGITLDQSFSFIRVVNVLVDEIESAIAESMLKDGGMFEQLGLLEKDEKRLKAVETCRFVAGLVLSSQSQRCMDVEDFMTRWTDLVPASFVKCCTVESLLEHQSGLFSVSTLNDGVEREIIKWNGSVFMAGIVLPPALSAEFEGYTGARVGTEVNAQLVAASSTAADKKRRWHEKFGAQRNQNR